MEKLIVILSLFFFFSCTHSRTDQCQKMTDIGISKVHNYLKILDSVEAIIPKIIEYRIENGDEDYFFADMFVSGLYIKGSHLPRHYQKITYQKRNIHLLVYCDAFPISQSDSLKILNKISAEKLVVNDVLEWTKNSEWSTNDFERFKFIFCKNNVSKFTTNTRLQDIEKNLNKPNCLE